MTSRSLLENLTASRLRINHPCGKLLGVPGWGRDRGTSLRLSDQELWLVWHGSGWMDTHVGKFVLRPGFLVWMRPGGIYDAGQDEQSPLGIIYVHFDVLDGRGRTRQIGPEAPEFYELPDASYVDAMMRRTIALYHDSANAPATGTARMYLAALLHDIAANQLSRILKSAADQLQPIGPRRAEMLATAGRLSLAADAPPVSEVARAAGLSTAYFSRAFRQANGISPRALTIRARIDRARQMLLESDLPLAKVADLLGYRDVYFFSRQFKKYTGDSPGAFRRRSLRAK